MLLSQALCSLVHCGRGRWGLLCMARGRAKGYCPPHQAPLPWCPTTQVGSFVAIFGTYLYSLAMDKMSADAKAKKAAAS